MKVEIRDRFRVLVGRWVAKTSRGFNAKQKREQSAARYYLNLSGGFWRNNWFYDNGTKRFLNDEKPLQRNHR